MNWLLGIFIFLVVVGGAYYWIKSRKKLSPPQPPQEKAINTDRQSQRKREK